MKEFACPHCKQQTFSKWDKYLAAKWKVLTCSNCKRRVASQPIWLAAYYLLYLANVIDLSFMAYLSGNIHYITAMVVIWVILDLFSLYLPLVAMRGGGSGKKKEEAANDSGGIGVTQSASMSLA
jgi:hypothetical protein